MLKKYFFLLELTIAKRTTIIINKNERENDKNDKNHNKNNE